MNIQIFGKSKCFDTKKAERWFKERRIKYQLIDVAKYGMSRGKYSLGMKQRLGIAQAIMEDQQLLILDEPMNALDKDAVEEMRRLFLSFKASGKTMLIVSHNEGDISTLCDEVYEFDGARIKRRENV